MSHLLDEILAQAANGSPITAGLSSESVAVLFFASRFLEMRINWLDKAFDPLDEVTDADWDAIEKLVGNTYEELMIPIDINPIGTIQAYGGDTAPDRWLLCDGSSVLQADYPDLFDVIGISFGQEDGDHFNLPDFLDRSPVGAGGSTITVVGEQHGAPTHTLNTGQLPAHNHGVTDPGHVHTKTVRGSGTAGGTVNHVNAPLQTTLSSNWQTDSATTGISIDNTGGGGSFDLWHPVLGVNFIIYAGV